MNVAFPSAQRRNDFCSMARATGRAILFTSAALRVRRPLVHIFDDGRQTDPGFPRKRFFAKALPEPDLK
jgi:hypothetical protein